MQPPTSPSLYDSSVSKGATWTTLEAQAVAKKGKDNSSGDHCNHHLAE
jgi:hypothetical protein